MKLKNKLTFIAGTVMAALLFCSPAMAADQQSDWKVGVGYQGMWAGEFLNGISGRAWYQDRFGIEGNFFYGGVDFRVSDGASFKQEADLYVGEIKLMYAPIIREYSKFYAGLQGSIGSFDLDGDLINYKDEIYGFGVFIGSEFHFQEFPELGFNFDVGYKHYFYEDRPFGSGGPKIDLELKGIGATFGIHYYF